MEFRSKIDERKLADMLDDISQKVGQPNGSKPAWRSFIVHGHDDKLKLEVKDYLQNVLELPEPLILHQQPSRGKSIIEKFEAAALGIDLVFVLLTPDDRCIRPGEGGEEVRRARQNVIFEMGYFLGKLGRHSGRVFLLHKGPLDLPSDIAGVIYIDVTHGIQSAGEQIRLELPNAGR